MKPDQASHFQQIVDLDGGSEEGMCKRSDCWGRQAGSIPCWTMEAGGKDGRCRACDHLPDCHPEDGKAQRKAFFDQLMREVDVGAAQARARRETPKESCPVCGAVNDPECAEEGHWWAP